MYRYLLNFDTWLLHSHRTLYSLNSDNIPSNNDEESDPMIQDDEELDSALHSNEINTESVTNNNDGSHTNEEALIDDEGVQFRSANGVSKPWPEPFNVSEDHMSYILKKSLRTEKVLDRKLKSSFLTCIYEQMTGYKM